MAEGERTFLGLTHNPFVEPYRGFFERGDRKTYLEQLRHLSQWSRRVLLVTGAEGVGKTTLYRELAATLEPRVKAARISGSLVNTGFEVLSAIAQGFGLAIPADVNTQSLRLDLIGHVEGQSGEDRLCLTLVDDAHLLDNKAVDSLIALAHESAMHLVLFGEVRMVPGIERAASAHGVGWQEIRLTGYGDADARDYLEWRFSQAKYRGRIPFTDNEVKDLIRLSEGLPGRINQMANVLLVKLETGDGIPRRSAFPRLHVALLMLVVVVVGLLYLLAGEGVDPESPQDASFGAGSPPALADVRSRTGSMAARQTGNAAVDSEAATEPEQDPGVTPETPAAAVSVMQPTDEPMSAASPRASEGAAEAPQAEAAPSLAEKPGVADVARSSNSALSEEPERPPAQEKSPEPDRSSEPLQSAEQTREREPEVAQPAPSIELPPGVRDSRWLLEQNPDYFILQLVTVSSADSARTFVSRQREPGEFTIYQLERDGRILHVVLYGLFSSRAAAEAAADDLPAEVGRVQPWIRPLAQVQAAARQ